MLSQDEKKISPLWAMFKSTWLIIAITLFLLLVLLWLLGYGPDRTCEVNNGTNTVTGTATTSSVYVGPDLTLNRFVPSSIDTGDATSGSYPVADNLSIVRIPLGSRFFDVGASAVDNLGHKVAVKVIGEVDTSTQGKYLLTYEAIDAMGNLSRQTRTVIVEAPGVKGKAKDQRGTKEISTNIAQNEGKIRLKLNGASEVSTPLGQAFIDTGAKAYDETDGDITIQKTGKVDSNALGKYTLTYTATNAMGNTKSVTRIVTVTEVTKSKDTIMPSVSLNGAAVVTIPQGVEYIEKGVTTFDDSNGEINVDIKGAIDINKPGKYEIIYVVTDVAGNKTTATRTVIVKTNPDKKPASNTKATTTDEKDGVKGEGSIKATSKGSTQFPTSARLYFGLNKFKPARDRDNLLPSVLQYLQSNPNSKVLISGFHDPSGNIDHNRQLAINRANVVSRLLQKKGISKNRIVIKEPTETKGTGVPSEARRVEVEVQ